MAGIAINQCHVQFVKYKAIERKTGEDGPRFVFKRVVLVGVMKSWVNEVHQTKF